MIRSHRPDLGADRAVRPAAQPGQDHRCPVRKYQEQYGDDSWELDAFEPQVMADLIREAVQAQIDQDYWEEAVARQDTGRMQLGTISRRWQSVVDFLARTATGMTTARKTMSSNLDKLRRCWGSSAAGSPKSWVSPSSGSRNRKRRSTGCNYSSDRAGQATVARRVTRRGRKKRWTLAIRFGNLEVVNITYRQRKDGTQGAPLTGGREVQVRRRENSSSRWR